MITAGCLLLLVGTVLAQAENADGATSLQGTRLQASTAALHKRGKSLAMRAASKFETEDAGKQDMYNLDNQVKRGKRQADSVLQSNKPDGVLHSTKKRSFDAPYFVGKRYDAPYFVGKRYDAPYFVGKRYDAPYFVGKRYDAPYFVGKRYDAPYFVGKRQFAPYFVGKRQDEFEENRESSPYFLTKRQEAPYFVGKRQDVPYFVGKREDESHLLGKRQRVISVRELHNLVRALRVYGSLRQLFQTDKRHVPMFVGRRSSPPVQNNGDASIDSDEYYKR